MLMLDISANPDSYFARRSHDGAMRQWRMQGSQRLALASHLN